MSTEINAETLLKLEDGTFQGIIENLSNDLYHSLTKYYSSTQLKYLVSKTPQHFKAKYIDKTEEVDVIDSSAYTLGSAIHCLVLTPNDFTKDFYVMPEFDGRTKEGKLIEESSLVEACGRTLISSALCETAKKMREASFAEFGDELLSAKTEVSFFWKCNYSGIMFRGRYDGYSESKKTLLELKSTQDASPAGFARQAYNLHYDLSFSHYEKGLLQLGVKIDRRKFLCIEKTYPFVAQSYVVGDTFIESGHDKWLIAVSHLDVGLRTNVWPGYVNKAVEANPVLEIPSWAMKKELLTDAKNTEGEW